jgi:two-component system, OmpR family, alkaline phosphatase synthesis response regulator PhoP
MAEKKKILIAEDEKPMARALEIKIGSDPDLEAKAVFNGAEALKILEVEKYDLVLTDLMMPDVDGFTLLKELKAKNIKIPVIISSNLSQEEDIKLTKSLGAIDYFVKSDTPISEVVKKIKKALGM